MAPYPFTTMTPNLGVMQATQQDADDFAEDLQKAVLADLPGLIQGAHQVGGLSMVPGGLTEQRGPACTCLFASVRRVASGALLPSGGAISLQHGTSSPLLYNTRKAGPAAGPLDFPKSSFGACANKSCADFALGICLFNVWRPCRGAAWDATSCATCDARVRCCTSWMRRLRTLQVTTGLCARSCGCTTPATAHGEQRCLRAVQQESCTAV